MRPLMKSFSHIALICLILIKNTGESKHLPSYHMDSLEDNMTAKERFISDVRALIKRHMQENEINNLHLENDNNAFGKKEGTNSMFDKPIAPAHVPTPVLVENWPTVPHSLGQISAVSIDTEGNPVIFHRADRYWDASTFNASNVFHMIEDGPIKEKTIYVLDPKTGAITSGWGNDLFYMPHGLTIDVHGNYWITDVAMHQAFKFKPYEEKPLLVVGKRFRPGSSVKHLCKPTSIAVATTGEFFIADGYCNHRVLKFNAAGRLLRTIPQPPEFLSLQVPHAITLLENLDLLCIADRENMRVVCPKAGLKSSQGEGLPAATIQEPDFGRVFGVAAYGNIVYAVNGPTSMLPVRGFTLDPSSESIIGHWGDFKSPHSVAVSANGSALYVTEIGANHQTNLIWKYILV
ncbi:peptidyl-alpha-hydroxyglycine alpha-amidating lyase 2 [Stomoxys calcitrans]|uniref:peptidylamidoglycolate lyase n=1 Tax=Stomoxys calcitrans TaxID=35570 RepID=A0A1I8Q792_STOCA|nr:peptidyl-alpha-hydroxyglycine alpha-amidating lyase 2 [Stomoxys calcitrans]